MDLCSVCSSISLESLTAGLPSNVSWILKGNRQDHVSDRRGMIHLQHASELAESALKCRLCALIQEALLEDQLASEPSQLPSDSGESKPLLSTDPVILLPKTDLLGGAFPDSISGGLHLIGFVATAVAVTNSGKSVLMGTIRLYTQGAITSMDPRDILGRPRLPDVGCDAAFALLKRWVEACRNHHADCRETFSGSLVDESTPPLLPARVIDVGTMNDRDSIRLFESNGASGRYAALSHCWGPPERQPLTTTRDNLHSHCRKISWMGLPKTFQDAITVVRGLGLRYIWIDSLCIVQDDHGDWIHESKRMGWIYERAELTIAASHAFDSWQGLFLPRSASPPVVELPSLLWHARNSVQVFATIRREEVVDTFPEHGPLSRRAWATQEWLLSRRMVFYTNGQMIWSCKTITQRETGETCYNTARNTKWKVIIEHYSERLLTIPTDRLIALEGLRGELGKKSGDEYFNGIWKNCLPDQLLWQVTAKVHSAPNPLGLPSWTWAALPCGVRFLLIKGAKNLCQTVRVISPGELFIRARFKPVVELRPNLNMAVGFSYHDGTVLDKVRADIAASNAKSTPLLACWLFDMQANILGWVVFDQWTASIPQVPLFCLALMGTISRRDDEKERRTNISVSRRLREYWVLVLQKSSENPESYVRVGVGKTYGRDWWQDATLKLVRII